MAFPFAAVGLGLAVASTAASVAGAAKADSSNKAATKAADKAATQNHKYTWSEMQDRYNYELDATNIARGNANNQRAYQNQVAKDNYDYQTAIQKQQYQGQKDAYRSSVGEYKQQLDLNKTSMQLGMARETQAFRDAQTDRLFSDASAMRDLTALTNQATTRRDTAANNFRSTQNDIQSSRAESLNQMRNTLASNNNDIKRNNADIQHQSKQFNADSKYTDQRINSNNNLTSTRLDQIQLQKLQNNQELRFDNKERNLLNNRGQKELDLRKKSRGLQIDQTRAQDTLLREGTRNTIDELTGQLGLSNQDRDIRRADAILQRDSNNQLRGSQVDELRSSLQIDAESRGNQRGSINDKVASQLNLSANERRQLNAELQFSSEQRGIAGDSANAELGYQEAMREAQSDAGANALGFGLAGLDNQALVAQAELNNSVGNTRRELQQREATNAFEMQAAKIEGLMAAGEQSASGRRGQSQAQNIGAVLAQVGRSQAKLSDSILRSRIQASADIGYARTKNNLQQNQLNIEADRQSQEYTDAENMRSVESDRDTSRRDTTISDLESKQRQAETSTSLRNESTRIKDANTIRDANRNKKQLDIDRKQVENQTNKQIDRLGIESQKENSATENALSRLSVEGSQDSLRTQSAIDKANIDKASALSRSEFQRKSITNEGRQDTARFNTEKRQRALQGNKQSALTQTQNRYLQSQKTSVRLENKIQNKTLSKNLGDMRRSLNKAAMDAGFRNRGLQLDNVNARNRNRIQQTALKNSANIAREGYDISKSEFKNQMSNNKANFKAELAQNKETLKSFKTSMNLNKTQMRLDKYGADIAAKSRVLAKPTRPTSLPKPYALPKTVFQDPRKPQKPPTPVKGAAPPSAIPQAIASGLGTIASAAMSYRAPTAPTL